VEVFEIKKDGEELKKAFMAGAELKLEAMVEKTYLTHRYSMMKDRICILFSMIYSV